MLPLPSFPLLWHASLPGGGRSYVSQRESVSEGLLLLRASPSSLPCFTLPAVVGPQPGPSILPSIPKVGYLKIAMMKPATFHVLHINLRKSSLMRGNPISKMLASLKLPTRRCFLIPSVCSPLSFFHRSHRCQCVGSLAPPSVPPSLRPTCGILVLDFTVRGREGEGVGTLLRQVFPSRNARGREREGARRACCSPLPTDPVRRAAREGAA